MSAASAAWQTDGDPIVVAGIKYEATRGFRLFDGQVMVPAGLYESVPVYSDVTIEPYSEAYVPVGNGRMRVYERRRDGELAGTTGSHVPTFPVASPSAVTPEERPVATSGTFVPRVAPDSAVLPPRDRRSRRTAIITPVRHSSGVTGGVWLDFDGGRWYSDGTARSYSPDRFEPVGEYHGFTVYRDKNGNKDDIWVAAVTDGPLAPYKKQ